MIHLPLLHGSVMLLLRRSHVLLIAVSGWFCQQEVLFIASPASVRKPSQTQRHSLSLTKPAK